MRAQCPTHLITLDLLTGIIFPEECKLRNFSLFSLPHYPVTLFLLGLNIFLNPFPANVENMLSS
jgi:hypothetical protein